MFLVFLTSLVLFPLVEDPTPIPLPLPPSPILPFCCEEGSQPEDIAPPEGDCYRWPSDEYIRSQLIIGTDYSDRLRAKMAESEWEAQKWAERLKQTEQTHEYYLMMLGVTNPSYDVKMRQGWLKRMRDMAGETRYWSVYLPPPIPLGEYP